MRVTEAKMLELATDAASAARDRSAAAQQVASSNVKVALPSDDLAAWTDGMRMSARLTASQARGKVIGAAQTDLQLTDDALSQIGQVLTSAVTLATQMGNDPLYANGPRAIGATQVQTLIDQAVAAANSRGTDGSYLLAGSLTTSPPFDPLGNYVGDNVTRSAEISEGHIAVVSETGSPLTAPLDVFATLRSLQTALNANDSTAVRATISNLQDAVSQIGEVRGEVGTRLQALNAADDARTNFEVRLAAAHTQDVAADPVQAMSDLTSTKNALDAALAVASQVVSLTQPK